MALWGEKTAHSPRVGLSFDPSLYKRLYKAFKRLYRKGGFPGLLGKPSPPEWLPEAFLEKLAPAPVLRRSPLRCSFWEEGEGL